MIWGYPYFRKPPYPFLNPVQVPRNPGGLVFGAESKGTQGSNGRSAPRSGRRLWLCSRLIQVEPVRVLLEGTPDFNRDLHSTSCWETTRSHIECLGTACMPRLKWSARSLHGTDRFQLKSHITNYFFGGGLGLVICIAGKSLKSNHPFPYVGYPESFKARRGPKFPPQMSFSFWRVKKEGKPHPRTILDKWRCAWCGKLASKDFPVGTPLAFCGFLGKRRDHLERLR